MDIVLRNRFRPIISAFGIPPCHGLALRHIRSHQAEPGPCVLSQGQCDIPSIRSVASHATMDTTTRCSTTWLTLLAKAVATSVDPHRSSNPKFQRMKLQPFVAFNSFSGREAHYEEDHPVTSEFDCDRGAGDDARAGAIEPGTTPDSTGE